MRSSKKKMTKRKQVRTPNDKQLRPDKAPGYRTK
jgi:hypothetical protein